MNRYDHNLHPSLLYWSSSPPIDRFIKLTSLADSLVNWAATIRRSNLLHSFHFLPHIFRHSSFLLLLSWKYLWQLHRGEEAVAQKWTLLSKVQCNKRQMSSCNFLETFCGERTFDKIAFRKKLKNKWKNINKTFGVGEKYFRWICNCKKGTFLV